jgi:hypothetical protein
MTDADPDFLAFLQQEETRALDSTLLDEVETAIKSYNGEEYGDEEDGRSRVVARDVAETTDYMLTSVLDAFVSSGRVVEFEPSSEDDEDTADDATEAMHYLYRRKSGYRLIHDWAKAGLLEKIGVVKSCVERKRKRVEGLYHPALMPDHAIEAEETDQLHPEDGSQLIKAVTLEEMAAEFRDYFVPLEEFRVAPDARDLDSAVYLCHLTEKSISDLVEMGFDPEVLDGVQGDSSPSSLANARDDGRAAFGTDRQGALRKVWLREEYVLFDLNGDGLAERLCVHRVGNTILAVEECDYQPFEYWCPYPMQGRLIGQSLADKTVDIQRVNTALERNGLDSLYMSVAPGTLIHESSIGDNTIEDLLTIRPRRIVRWKGSAPPIPEQVQDISQIAFSAIEFKTRQRESRTGITRLNKGVDEDTLNDTAKGQAQLMSRGQQMERYIIRNFAEGVARLFMKKVGLMRKYAEPFQIRVDGEYRQVDPSQWPEDMEVNVKVGLGSGSKDERIMYRNMIAQSHTLLMQGQAPICTWENVYNNLAAAAKDAGLQPNDIYTHPEDAPQQQPQQDPALMKLQGELQIKQQQLQQAQQEGQAKLALMAQQHASENQIAQARAEMEAQLALRQQNVQAWLDAHQMALDAHKQHHEMQLAAQTNKAKVSQMRKGGRLDK